MRNPHNAAADALVARHLDTILQEIAYLDSENPDRWIIRLEVKPGFDSHPLHGATFDVIAVNGRNPTVGVTGSTSATSAAQSFCTAVLTALRDPDDEDW